MRKIVFDTDQAEFRFEVQAVIKYLCLLNKEQDRSDPKSITDELVTTEAEEITLQTTPDWFGFVIIALLEKGEGLVFCKRCGRAYEPTSLSKFPLGAGTSPFDVVSLSRASLIDRLFRCPRRMHSMLGGKGFRCPAGHKLISAVTWIS